MITLADIQSARERIGDAIYRTPCAASEYFSRLLGCDAWFKLDNLQRTGSFKERGALNRLLLLDADARRRGVICASAGNHAQGVASHAGRLGIPATIVMPEATPLIKVSSTRAHGAHVVLHGANFDEALAEARRIERETGAVFVHPFDDEAVIAGQGTCGLEILEQVPNLGAVVVPIGGGGLIGGIACAVKSLAPHVRVIGVETQALPKMTAALAAHEPVTLPPAPTLADGIAVRRAGDRTLPLVERYVDEVVQVDDEEIANAILLLLEREKTLAEGAGAAALAAVLHHKTRVDGLTTAMLVCGGNIDVTLLSRIIERGLVKDGRLVRLQVVLPDRPGALATLLGHVATQRANVVEVHHERAFSTAALGQTRVDLVLEARGHDHVSTLMSALRSAGYVLDIH